MAEKANHPPMRPADLRRRVRRITVAVAGAAALAAAGLTVNLAWATDDPAASSSSATTEGPTQPSTGTSRPAAQTSEEESEGEAQARSPQQNVITTPPTAAQAPLLAPQQAPLAGGGRSHTQSGGS